MKYSRITSSHILRSKSEHPIGKTNPLHPISVHMLSNVVTPKKRSQTSFGLLASHNERKCLLTGFRTSLKSQWMVYIPILLSNPSSIQKQHPDILYKLIQKEPWVEWDESLPILIPCGRGM